jgi:beta-mannosidase
MQWHQRSPKGNEKIRDMIPQYFNPPKDFDSSLWLSQIVQGYGIKIGAEYWRQTMPKSMACVYWQYNDCWPVASWSSVDYFGRWKALHYLARRFYAPVLVSGLEDPKSGTIDIFVTSDRLAQCHGTVSWTVTDLAGKALSQDSMPLEISPRKSQKIKTLALNEHVQHQGANNLLTWLKLTVDGQVVSENLVSLTPPKEMKLLNPNLKPAVAKAHEGFFVTVAAEKPALWIWLELGDADAKFSDNFVHLNSGGSTQILVQPKKRLSKMDFEKTLRVRSLFDTYA